MITKPAPSRAESSDLASGDLDQAVLRTLAYSDVFDFPLTALEIHRYLVATRARRDQVDTALARLAPARVSRRDDLVALRGREQLFELRRRRTELAQRLWPAAHRHGLALARTPFVRMVGLTGAVAAGNPTEDGDIDYFLVTEPGRLWIARTAVVQRVRLARLSGHLLCPNYPVSQSALALEDGGLYAARELAQLLPIAGHDVYRELRRANPWVERHLPNAAGAPREPESGRTGRTRMPLAARCVESALRAFGGPLETGLRRLRIREIRASAPSDDELTLDADRCKAHTSGHARSIRAAYAERLSALDLRE